MDNDGNGNLTLPFPCCVDPDVTAGNKTYSDMTYTFECIGKKPVNVTVTDAEDNTIWPTNPLDLERLYRTHDGHKFIFHDDGELNDLDRVEDPEGHIILLKLMGAGTIHDGDKDIKGVGFLTLDTVKNMLYMTEFGRIWRVHLKDDGGISGAHVIANQTAEGIAVDSDRDRVYWVNNKAGSIQWIDGASSSVLGQASVETLLAEGAFYGTGLAAAFDSGHMFWATQSPAIWRIHSEDGQNVTNPDTWQDKWGFGGLKNFAYGIALDTK